MVALLLATSMTTRSLPRPIAMASGLVPILLPEADRKAAYLMLGQAQSALRVLGPTVAGIIVAVSSPGWALLVDAATFFVAAIFLTLVRLPDLSLIHI